MKCIYKNKLGKNGELIAKEFLLKKNLKFIQSNFKFYRAEIDLIFEDIKNKIIIFVEVKTRRNETYGKPEESINLFKQKQIRKAVNGFIMLNGSYGKHDLRIDTVSVLIKEGKCEINHIENAFS